MPRLQEVKRANGSIVHSINIPQELIERVGWKKGEELTFQADELEGQFRLIITREGE